MRIENSSLQASGASPLDKLRRPASSIDATLEDVDLSFMDLLSSIVTEGIASPTRATTPEKTPDKQKTTAAQAKEKEGASKLSLVARVSTTHADEPIEAVDHDMVLLKDALTPVDVQYMKQVVIPGLPILVGNVPSNSIFPTGEEGEISYKGFEVSSKLSEMIEKGYRSGRPIRVELDPNSAVVIKIRNGQVSAQFVSTDKSALSMQHGLDDLRNRMLARNLPVGQLEYQYRDPGQGPQKEQPETPQNTADTEPSMTP